MAAISKDLQRVIADGDRDHPPECPVDKRRRELAEAREAEKRAQQAQQAREVQQLAKQQQVSDSWVQWTDQRIAQHLDQWMGRAGPGRSPLISALREVRPGKRGQAQRSHDGHRGSIAGAATMTRC
jgi:hypothetical protein